MLIILFLLFIFSLWIVFQVLAKVNDCLIVRRFLFTKKADGLFVFIAIKFIRSSMVEYNVHHLLFRISFIIIIVLVTEDTLMSLFMSKQG